jgi:hypothetical protein
VVGAGHRCECGQVCGAGEVASGDGSLLLGCACAWQSGHVVLLCSAAAAPAGADSAAKQATYTGTIKEDASLETASTAQCWHL